MKIVKTAKKAAKFMFVSMPLSIFGWRSISTNHQHLKDLVNTIRNPHCPVCDRGVMFVQKDAEPDKNALYPWICSGGCGFGVFTNRDPNSINEVVIPLISKKGRARLNGMSEEEQLGLIKSHTRQSRMFWVLAAFCPLIALYSLATGGMAMTCISILSMAVPFSILAIKWSYRAWQVHTGTLYVEGAFKQFVKRGLWLPRVEA
ncbi:hypothetical protein ALQ54_01825 [Pseudomonas syringae]|uniref:hypothetical protein n=1 Tax=Pseudomonas syringae TaxID=317 RepID=UPI000EFB02CF|nr:hypothetical protein [Pseudomonas syringae]RMN74286.1 hypothetical protein ALQ54_01825 [Pseudomonas syringae]